MRPLIKVCGITNRRDAELAMEAGADYLGMILYPKSPRSVSVDTLRELCEIIPPSKRVLVDVATGTDVLEHYLEFEFAAFQMHFDLAVDMATIAAWAGIVGADRLWLAPRIPVEERYFPQMIMEFCQTVVLDTYSKNEYGGTGKTGNWQRFIDWSTLYQHKRWILAGGLTPENIIDAIHSTDPAIIDVNSGIEDSPGTKSPARLLELFRVVRPKNTE